jgi:hypothetical protein
MTPHPPDEDSSNIKKYHRHQPVIITSNIENVSVISYRIHRVEDFLHIMEIPPIRNNRNPVPIIQRIFSINVATIEIT